MTVSPDDVEVHAYKFLVYTALETNGIIITQSHSSERRRCGNRLAWGSASWSALNFGVLLSANNQVLTTRIAVMLFEYLFCPVATVSQILTAFEQLEEEKVIIAVHRVSQRFAALLNPPSVKALQYLFGVSTTDCVLSKHISQ